MNRFIIEETPRECAQSHCDKHIVKMPTEEAQMLSTVHRILDGTETRRLSSTGKTMAKYWELEDDREQTLYKAVHPKHPCTLWAMETLGNYRWAYALFEELCEEYSYRYNREHAAYTRLAESLRCAPDNIPKILDVTPMPLAMKSNPECINHSDVIGSYRHFYATKKERFSLTWKNRDEPVWWDHYVEMVG